MSRPNVISAFLAHTAAKQGQELRSGQPAILYTSSDPLLIFYVLTIRKQLPESSFERSGRGQEPSRGHKFSILENAVFHRDFTSSMHLHFRSDLVGVALVGAAPLHLLSQTALPLKSPTGAFIAPLRCANASLPRDRRNRLISPAKKNRKFPSGNSLPYLSCGFLRGASYSGAHPVFVLSGSACGLFFWRIIRFNTQHSVTDPHMGLNQMRRTCA